MTQQEILDYNKRCTNILKWKLVKGKFKSKNENHKSLISYINTLIELEEEDGIKINIYEELKFHSDWNWIMEVVDAIEKLGYKFQLGWNITALISLVTNTPAKIAFIESENRKEAVVQAINQFLIWYNEHTSKLLNS